eukprot:CAMPEP_0197629276 /NCGR_PEP_ID=MMETSP1338-20131121/7197_1 /TAXON_ID=43686 ORGANISM="Pelagodinium beii, Strain RCC1491" /NCGR_SAMPLE_ID=MMETSP1338 /ASSEMBLY_ACC=CAM_ASM_000754 /LENGTH=73 /DNA_ID=CAMNT_0043200303 /DNA_START=522 /DNA_END=743 /DNA_ORIENTATION=-
MIRITGRCKSNASVTCCPGISTRYPVIQLGGYARLSQAIWVNQPYALSAMGTVADERAGSWLHVDRFSFGNSS